MDAKGKKRMIIWVSVAALLGVGGYVAWMIYKSKKAKPDAQTPTTPAQPSGETATSQGQNTTPPVSNTGAYQAAWKQAKDGNFLTFWFEGKVYSAVTGTVINNPFKNKSQIIAFQTFVKNVMKDNSVGVIDGVWGPRTAAAFIKYANKYYANK